MKKGRYGTLSVPFRKSSFYIIPSETIYGRKFEV